MICYETQNLSGKQRRWHKTQGTQMLDPQPKFYRNTSMVKTDVYLRTLITSIIQKEVWIT